MPTHLATELHEEYPRPKRIADFRDVHISTEYFGGPAGKFSNTSRGDRGVVIGTNQ
jgi:hypothetical protein